MKGELDHFLKCVQQSQSLARSLGLGLWILVSVPQQLPILSLGLLIMIILYPPPQKKRQTLFYLLRPLYPFSQLQRILKRLWEGLRVLVF